LPEIRKNPNPGDESANIRAIVPITIGQGQLGIFALFLGFISIFFASYHFVLWTLCLSGAMKFESRPNHSEGLLISHIAQNA